MKKLSLLAAALFAGHVATLEAQTPDEIRTYIAVSRTPVGALPPILTSTMINRLQNGGSLSLRYGNLTRGDHNAQTHAFGVTGILTAGLGSTVSLTGGVIRPDCAGCKAELMLGVGGDMGLYSTSWGSTSTSSLFTMTVNGDLGYGNADPGSYISGHVGLPLALVQRGTGMQFVPFLTPAFAFARQSVNGVANNGSGMMLGGGLGIYNLLTNTSLNVGAQHSFMNGARNVIGLNVTIGGK